MVENTLVIDGIKFKSFTGFIQYMNTIAFDKSEWNGNLDAFNDYLTGGFGNAIEGKSIRIINEQLAKEALGNVETEKWLRDRMNKCHPSNIVNFLKELENITNNKAELLWDKIIGIIKLHSENYTHDNKSEIHNLEIL
jgi:hypothetical protein